MAARQLIYETDAREALLRGVDTLTRAVRKTLGPKGRNVALDRQFGAPLISPDGVTVAKEIDLADPYENMGAQLLKQAASKTGDIAGDGTTTATVLAQTLVEEGLKLVSAGANPLLLKRGLDAGLRLLVAEIKRQAVPVAGRTEIAQVAAVSALDTDIGEMLATIFEQAGRDAVITVEESQGTTTEYELVEGMQFDRGYISPYFATDAASMEAELEDPYILITDQKIAAVADLLPVLELITQSGTRDLVIIAEDVTGDALTTLVVNKLRGTLNPLAVKAPRFGDRRKAMLQDIAVLTGGMVITEELGRRLESVQLVDLGQARRVHADKDETILIEGHGDKATIAARIAQIRAQIEVTTSDFDREKLQERAAKLSGGIVVIRVGAATETALQERKARIDDALHATRAALDEGIVPGGGLAYMNLVGALDAAAITYNEDRMAINMLRHALEEPAYQIAENAGEHGAVIVAEIERRQQASGNAHIGYDAMRGEYGDMVDMRHY